MKTAIDAEVRVRRATATDTSHLVGLLGRAVEAMRGSGIRLDAFAKNPAAIRLYLKLGYTQAGTVQFRKGAFICFEKMLHR